MRRTAFKKRPRKLRPRQLREGAAEYGPRWKAAAERARKRDRGRCVVCGEKPVVGEHAEHHIIPVRMFSSEWMSLSMKFGLVDAHDAHDARNVATVCAVEHAAITHAVEPKLLRGDIVGFWRGMVSMGFPVERLRTAFRYYGLPEVQR